MSEYNYQVFDLPEEMKPFERFPDSPHPGQKAPSLSLEDLDSGDVIELKSLWKKDLVILEFGSFT